MGVVYYEPNKRNRGKCSNTHSIMFECESSDETKPMNARLAVLIFVSNIVLVHTHTLHSGEAGESKQLIKRNRMVTCPI